MSKKTQPAPAQEQPHVEPIESAASPLADTASADHGNPQEPSGLPAGEPGEVTAGSGNSDHDPVQPPEAAIVGEITGVGSPDVLPPAFHPEVVGLDLSTSEDVNVTIATLDLSGPKTPDKIIVRLLFAQGQIPAGKAVFVTPERAETLIAQGDADGHPEAVQYALAQAPAVELAD